MFNFKEKGKTYSEDKKKEKMTVVYKKLKSQMS